ncbi:hypothetical protein R3W88_031872 [Solanum pinnatisectum]|uniref:Retrotransposon gag domain-containing protein n=1 Tax=Solanum pinnatisectum TaxID=50273 RepID=A0AAV9LMJ2_9SOLN|nr:hypothetical protein R3W88_031872 [Solanum pinnatisectum]
MPPPVQGSISDLVYPSEFGPYASISNVVGTSTVRSLSTPMTSYPLFVPTAPTNSVPQLTMVPKSNNDPSSKGFHDHGYIPKEALKIPGVYPHTHHYSSSIEVEKVVKNEEHEEMARKMKSLEQSVRDMQGLRGHKGISFSDLCIFPHVHFPVDFKTPKFEKYDDQDISNWHTWDNLARCFVQQFQYNIDIVPDCSSLSNMRKKTTENFNEYVIRWREQAARVKLPMKESEIIDVFL